MHLRTKPRSAPRLLRALALAIVAMITFATGATRLGPTVAHAGGGPSPSPVDDWLSAHHSIANALIWEFPPSRVVKIPPRRFIVWQAPGVFPDPGPLLPLEDLVFDWLERGVAPAFSVRSSFFPSTSVTVEVAAMAGDGSLPSDAVPGNVPTWLPGGVKTSEYGAAIRSWSKWPEWAKAELRVRFAPYQQWAQTACPLYDAYAASGFTVKPAGFDAAFTSLVDLDPVPVSDPPINIQPDDPLVDGTPWAMVESGAAFALYVRLVAAQLAIEMTGCVPWSVLDYAAADLRPLFDGREIFRYVPAGPSYWGEMTATGHVMTTTVTPAPPLVVLGFLAQNGLIGSDRTDTVVRLLEWERFHLQHVIGGAPAPPLTGGDVYWGYNGRAPVSRMISGTVMAAPLFQSNGSSFIDSQMRHWVAGCGGASGFNPQVLRTVNIAAFKTAYAHHQNLFALDNDIHAGIGHGDTPYGMAAAPEIPLSEILIDEVTFNAWFVNETDPNVRLSNVSRREAELFLEYLPQYLLWKHCQDLAAGTSHADSKVYHTVFTKAYSVAELEALGLWTGIEAKLAALGGCAALGF